MTRSKQRLEVGENVSQGAGGRPLGRFAAVICRADVKIETKKQKNKSSVCTNYGDLPDNIRNTWPYSKMAARLCTLVTIDMNSLKIKRNWVLIRI